MADEMNEETEETAQGSGPETGPDSGVDAASFPFEKADLVERTLAKAIDLIIAGAILSIPTFVAPAAALLYLLIADGLKGGQSIGKKIIGLKVISLASGDGAAADFRASLMRNANVAAILLLYLIVGCIPYVGIVAVVVVGGAVAFYEGTLVYNDELGIRFGDRLAVTMVTKN